MPYLKVAEILKAIGAIEISASSIWRRVERWGEQIQKVEKRQQVKAYELIEPQPHDPNRSLGPMGVALDGTTMHIREEGWKELKVGTVYEVGKRLQQDVKTQEEMPLGSAKNTTYVAHLGGPETFGRQVWAEARQRNWMDAVDTQVIGDGAAWIWNLASEHFYASHQTLDWFHACEHLAAAAQILYADDAQRKRWYRRWRNKLYQGQVHKLIKALKAQAARQPTKTDELQVQITYFQNNKKRMNYLEMRAEGYPIGSGMVESAAKQFKARFCGSGMRWSRTGSERLIPVRSAILSRRFDKIWQLAYNSPQD